MYVGSYELLNVVGEGGMAQVWRARRLDVGDHVALKIITASGAQSPRYRRYFDNEIGAVARLSHPGIVQILDLGALTEHDADAIGFRRGTPYLAMELIEGPTLDAPGLGLDWLALRDILLELLGALAHAHARDVLHLDIKPANVLLAQIANRFAPRLTDFGIARIHDTADATDSERVVGTPLHMAPEQILGGWRDYGPPTDLYAVASLTWQLLTGRAPFLGDTTFEILKSKTERGPGSFGPSIDVPDALEAWLRRGLSRDVRDRFPTAADAAWALRRLASKTTATPPIPPTWTAPEPPPTVERSGALIGLRVPPFVGRTELRDTLWAKLREASQEGARGVCLYGAVGIGKTRSAEWLCCRAAELGAATCFFVTHGAVRTPLDGLSGLLARHFKTTSLDRTETVARIRDSLAQSEPVDEAVLMDAVSLGEIALPPRSEERGHQMTVTEMARIVGRYLARVARQRPVILVLDDVQWGADSAEVARALFEANRNSPVLVVMTLAASHPAALDTLLPDLAGHPAMQSLELQPLGDGAAAELVQNVLPASRALVRHVTRQCGGNPAFIIEALADLSDRGELVRTSEGWRLRDDTQPSSSSLAGLWTRRVQFVASGESRDWIALETAAALGLKFDGPQWREACDALDATPAPELLERMIRYRIVRLDVPEDRAVDAYAFAHETLRQSILEHAESAGRRGRIERACAEMLERQFPETQDPAMLQRIATHWVNSDRAAAALPYLARAALRHHHRAELKEARALIDQHRALSATLKHVDPAQELTREVYSLWIDERHGDAIALSDVENLLARAEELDQDELYADAARLKAKLLSARGAPDAYDDLEAVAKRLSPATAPLTLARVLLTIGWGHGMEGDWERAFEQVDRAIELFEQYRDHHWASTSLRARAYLLAQRGEYEAARAALDRAMGWAREGGDRSELAGAYQHLGEIHRYAGNLEAALVEYLRAESLFSGVSEQNVLAARVNRALVEIERGQWDSARRLLDDVTEKLEQYPGAGSVNAFARLALALTAARDGDWSRWIDVEDVIYDAERRNWLERDLAWLLESMGDTACNAGHEERARICYSRAASVWEGVGRLDDAVRVQTKLTGPYE